MAHDVMISYASENKTTADAICAVLEAFRIRCWIFPRDNHPGMEYGEGIVLAISECRCMVLVYSHAAEGSPHVRSEIERAFSMEKPIISFRVEAIQPSTKTEFFLAKTHWLDALTPPIEARIAELTQAVGRLLNAPAVLQMTGSAAPIERNLRGPVLQQSTTDDPSDDLSVARHSMKRGIVRIANAVKVTFGPNGRAVTLYGKSGETQVLRDATSILRAVELQEPHESMGVKFCRDAAASTYEAAGGGGATTILLLQALLDEGLRYVEAGADPRALAHGIHLAVGLVVDQLKKVARPLEGRDQIASIAGIAGKSDEIGELVAEAMNQVGKDGIIFVEESKRHETSVDIVEGMQFDSGYISPYFVTDPESMEAVLERPMILLHEKKISDAPKFVGFLEKVAQTHRPILIITEDIEGDALATIVLNKIRGVLQIVAVKAPAFGDRRKAMFEDIATLTNGKFISSSLPTELDDIAIDMLGTAGQVLITKDQTTIIQGAGSKEAVLGRLAQIRSQIEETDSDYDREKLQERLAKLSGGVAVIKVGAFTEKELKERKRHYEMALKSVRAAAAEGIVPGGGAALFAATGALDHTNLSGDGLAGVSAVRRALQEPIRRLAYNSGVEADAVVALVRGASDGQGWDAVSNQVVDMFASGIVDPVRALRCAVENSAHAADLVLSADTLVVL